MQVPKTIVLNKRFEGKDLADFVYDSLVEINKLMDNESTYFTEETTLKVTDLVQILRAYGKRKLKSVWDRCIIKKDLKMT